MEEKQYNDIKLLAAKVRRDVVAMLQHRGYGHVGGSLSLVEAYAVLYGKQMKYDSKNPKWEERDRIVLSKGHAGPVAYSTLAEVGFFPTEWLYTLNDGGTRLPSHTDRLKTPGIDATTGSLGQGTSEAVGIALALDKKGSDAYTYLFVGDGELNEGQCWESFQFAAANKLHNLIVFIDDNKRQLDGWTKDVMNPFDIAEKMRAFGFNVIVIDGHSYDDMEAAFANFHACEGKPTCILMKTTKRKGVSYMTDSAEWHGKAPNDAEYEVAMGELRAQLAELEAAK